MAPSVASNRERIPWFDEEGVARRFLEQRPELDQMVSEVVFLLRHRLQRMGIEVAHITARVKSLPSLLDKMKRKHYRYPLDEVTDLAGVRVVCLYPWQLERVAQAVKDSFEVAERVVKAPKSLDAFGYEALHHIVRLRADTSGARRDVLRKYRCEIQVRTVLQDAWAIIDHHLRYKTEDQIPQRLRRDLFALAAVLQNADRQFEAIAQEKERYFKRLAHPRTSLAALLKEDTNSQSVAAYLKRKFPKKPLATHAGHLEQILEPLRTEKYPTIAHIDRVVEQTVPARRKYRGKGAQRTATAQLGLALACVDIAYRKRMSFSAAARAVFTVFDESRKKRASRKAG